MPTISTLSIADHLTTSPPSVATQVVGEVVGLCFLAVIVCCLTYAIIRFCKCSKKRMNDSKNSSSEEGTPKKAAEGDVEAPSVSFSEPSLSNSCPVLLEVGTMEEIELKEQKNEEHMMNGEEDKETGEYYKKEGSNYEMVHEKEDKKDIEGTDEDHKKGDKGEVEDKKDRDNKEGTEEDSKTEQGMEDKENVDEGCKNGESEHEEGNEKKEDERQDVVDCMNTGSNNEVENERNEGDEDDFPEIEGYGIVDLELLEDALRESPQMEEEESDVGDASNDPEENPFMEKKTEHYAPMRTIEYYSGHGNIVVTYNPCPPPRPLFPVFPEIEEEQREETEAGNVNDYVYNTMEDLTGTSGETLGDGNVENVNQQEENTQVHEECSVARYDERQFLLLDLNSSSSEVSDSDEENEMDEAEKKEGSDVDKDDKKQDEDKEDKKENEDNEDKKEDEDKEDKKEDEDKKDKKEDEDMEGKKEDEDKEGKKEDEDMEGKKENEDTEDMEKDDEDKREGKADKNEDKEENYSVDDIKDDEEMEDKTAEHKEEENEKAEEDEGKGSENEEGGETPEAYNYIFLSCDEATDDELLGEARRASSRPRRHSPVNAEALSDESDDSIYFSYREDDDDEEAELFEWGQPPSSSPLQWSSLPSLHRLRAVMMAAQDPELYRRAREAYVRAVSALGLTMPGQIVHPHLRLPQDLSQSTCSPREAAIAAARARVVQDK